MISNSQSSQQTLHPSSYTEKTGGLSILLKNYLSVLKLGIVFPNLMTAFIAMWLAEDGFHHLASLPIITFILSIFGIFLILSSGTSFNNFFDQDIDQKMDRTKERVLAKGSLKRKHVLILSLVLLVSGIILLSFVHVFTAFLALIGWIGYSIIYTIGLKRRHWINTLIGSVPGAFPPLIGWSAVNAHLSIGALLFFLIMFFWQPPHFYAIAIKRREDYKKAGIPMLPVVKSLKSTQRHIKLFIPLLILTSLTFYIVVPLNIVYIGLAVILGIGWFITSMLKKQHDIQKWAQSNFKFSLIYLLCLLLGMFIGSI